MSLFLIAVAQFNFLTFHTLAELFAIVISFVMFAFAWTTFDLTKNYFLLFLACGYFWIGSLDLVHTLVYTGMNVIVEGNGNLAVQFWIATRYAESLLLLSAIFMASRSQKKYTLFCFFGAISIVLLVLIFTGNFPTGFVEGVGLTDFKIYSEYLIDFILLLALVALFHYGAAISSREKALIAASIIMTMGAEIAFTFYVSVFGLSNLAGHIFKLFSFWLIFQAIVVSNLKRPYAALQESEAIQKMILESAPDGIILYDIDGTILASNNTAAKRNKLPRDKIIDQNFKNIFPPDIAKEWQNIFKQVIDTKKTVVSEIERAGNIYEISFWPILSDSGNVYRISSFSRDITERKFAEEQLRMSESRLLTAQELVKLGYFEHDVITKRSYWSDIVCDIFGVEYGGRVSYQDFVDFVHPDDRDNLKREIDNFIHTGGTYKAEYRIVRADGEIRYLVITGLAVASDKDGVTKYVGALVDVTEERSREDQLRQAQKMEAVGQLTAGIAHDFNNILTELSMGLSLAGDELGIESVGFKGLVDAQLSISKAAKLTNQLLAFSRKQVLNPKPTDVNLLVRGMEDLLQRTLGERVVIEITCLEDLWPCMIDQGQLEVAFLNLAINARDAMPEGGTLEIDCRNERVTLNGEDLTGGALPGDYIVLTVADSGTGISEDYIEKIFEPFFTTKDVGEGSGLGLSMVYGFIRQSGGYIEIKSEEGKGAEFKLYLPRSRDTVNQEIKVTNGVSTPKGSGETILIIEDNVILRRLAIRLLEKLNYNVIDGGDGSDVQGVAQQHNGKIDLLFSDVILTQGNTGSQIARRMQDQDADIKVLLMTGYADLEARDSTGLKVQYPLLNKPFDIDSLASAVHNALHLNGG